MQNLKDALADLKAEVLNGKTVTDLLAEIAGDYSVNPALLSRKFAESYGSETALRANSAASDKAACSQAQIDREVAAMCSRYGVSVEGTFLARVKGDIYTIICHVTNCPTWRYRAVRHSDAAPLKLHRSAAISRVN